MQEHTEQERSIGRPPKITKAIVNKLEEVFALGGTDEEACMFADISRQTLYNYQKDNPEFVDRKKALKEKPILKARRTVVGSLDDANHAFKFLERKRRNEFGQQLDINAEVTKKIVSIDE